MQVRQEPTEQLVLRESLEQLVLMVLQAQPVQRGRQEHKALQVRQGPMEQQVLTALMVPLVQPAQPE